MAKRFRNLDNSEGHVLSFSYSGGSNPNAQRTIYVLEVEPRRGNIFGWDFDKEAIRQFKQAKMNDVYALEDDEVVLVKLDMMPAAYRDGDLLSRQYRHDGYQVYVNEDLHFLVAVKQQGTRFSISRKLSGVTLSVHGKGGRLNVEIPNDRDVLVTTLFPKGKAGSNVYRNITAEKLHELLEKVV